MAVRLFEREEGVPVTCTISSYDRNGELALPSTLTYTVIDELAGTTMQSGTLGADGNLVEDAENKCVLLTILGSNSMMVNQAHASERRIVKAIVNGIPKTGTYRVKNVKAHGVT